MSKEVLDILSRISLERNIPVNTLYDALESALISASKKMLPSDVDVVEAELDRETGEFRIYANMNVVDEIFDEHTEILLEEAREYVEDVQVGEQLVIDVTPDDFGRIAAQSAKQVITQRIREAEREVIYDKYKNRVEDLVVGTVQRYEKGNVIVDLGNADAVLPSREQSQGERYRYGDRLKAIILDIRKSSKDAQIVLSRKTPLLVSKLFEQEVAEIRDSVVTIRRVAREPGRRSKIAVLSSDSDVDPVGACVGMKGSRVQMVVQELRGERIDIVEYSDDKRRFVANSLKPANIESVELDEHLNRALLVVRDEELALAIGKNGLNAKLATELTGVEIDIITESQLSEREAEAKRELLMIPSMKDFFVDSLLVRGIIKLEDVVNAGVGMLSTVEDIDKETAALIFSEAESILRKRKESGKDKNTAVKPDEREKDQTDSDEDEPESETTPEPIPAEIKETTPLNSEKESTEGDGESLEEAEAEDRITKDAMNDKSEEKKPTTVS